MNIALREHEGRALTMALGGDPDAPRTSATEAEIRKAIDILDSCARQMADDPADMGEACICAHAAETLRRVMPFAAAAAFVRAVAGAGSRMEDRWPLS